MVTKKSPLKAKPLRQAGQSVQEKIIEIFDDKVAPYILVPAFMIALACIEWYRSFFPAKPQPLIVTALAVISLLYCVPKIISIRRDISNLKQGRDGEIAVGQFLEILREDGCIVFHDIVGDKFNIDHVVLSEKGVYLIETKTYSKPTSGKPTVHYKKGILRIDGIGDASNILNQVKAAAVWLKKVLKESTGKDFQIKPVILFPGWWIESNDYEDIWVLEAKGFPKFLSNAKEQITKEDKKLAAYHLSRYIRAL